MFRNIKNNIRKKEYLVYLLIFLSIFLRVYGFWSKPYNPHEVLGLPLSSENVFNPVSYSFIKDIIYRSIIFVIIQVIGESPAIVRIPNVIASILTVFILYKLFSEKKGLFAMISFSFMTVYYGQIAHPVSFSLLFYLLSWLNLKNKRINPAIIYALISILSYWAFLPYIFLTFLIFAFKYRDKKIYYTLPIFFLLGGLFLVGSFAVAKIISVRHGIRYDEVKDIDIVFPGYQPDVNIINILVFLSGMHSYHLFIIYLSFFLIGILSRKNLIYILTFITVAALIYFWSIAVMKFIHPRYFVPMLIPYLEVVYHGIKFLLQKLKIFRYFLILLFIISNLITYLNYIRSPFSFDLPFLIDKEKINREGDIIYVQPTYGKTEWDLYILKSAFISLISCNLKSYKLKFLTENKKYYEVIAIGGGFRKQEHEIISIKELDFPNDIYIVITPIFYPQIGGMLQWWKIKTDDIEKLNERINEKLRKYGIDQIDSSASFIGFRYKFKDEDEFKKMVRYISKILFPMRKYDINFN